MILYITNGDYPDLQDNMLLHGLKSLYGTSVIDSKEVWFLYKSSKEKYWTIRIPENGNSFGYGFTLPGSLDDNLSVCDRSNIEEMIRARVFNKIIFGSIHRCRDYIDLVFEVYPKNKIVFIDGEDHSLLWLEKQPGQYFKRELLPEDAQKYSFLFPINFAVPKKLIVSKIPKKTKFQSEMIPGKLSSYKYDSSQEDEYHKQYQESWTALTMKKAGWDCLRHYEIIMNGCIPYFPTLSQCPKTIMTKLPKELLEEFVIKRNEKALLGDYFDDVYFTDVVRQLLQYAREYLTTEALAIYVLS